MRPVRKVVWYKSWKVVQRKFFFSASAFLLSARTRFLALRINTSSSSPQPPASSVSSNCSLETTFSSLYPHLPHSIQSVLFIRPSQPPSPSQTAQTTQHRSHLSDLHLSPRYLRSSSSVSMASTSASADTSATPSTPKKYNLRNPLPLSASQEQEVKQMYYKRVRARCAPEIKGM
jgi:hypothetical protein